MLRLIVVGEFYFITNYGHDFRPEVNEISKKTLEKIVKKKPSLPLLLMSASIMVQNTLDIQPVLRVNMNQQEDVIWYPSVNFLREHVSIEIHTNVVGYKNINKREIERVAGRNRQNVYNLY